VRENLRLLSSDASLKPVLERYLKQLIKYHDESDPTTSSVVLEHFVRREVARRMREEAELASMEELVYRLPFKMQVQTLLEDNKAIDERTREDVERFEREAKREIETNFPSYYDELQRVMFNGVP
jgi:hypothetical protein